MASLRDELERLSFKNEDTVRRIAARNFNTNEVKAARIIVRMLDKISEKEKDGGPGSGNFGHAGRPGEVGGSGGGGGSSGSGGKNSGESGGKENSGANKTSVSRPATPAKTSTVKAKEFVPALDKAKATCPPDKAWRVDTSRSPEDFESEGITTYTTEGGSTFALKPDGDIISVCKNQQTDSGTNARDIMAAAVAQGGTHLDSYDGNYGFYVRCGFEPVSRCKFDKQWAPPGWTEGRDAEEDIYFMKYVGVGKVQHTTIEQARKNIPYSADYDAAEAVVKAQVGGKK